MAGPAQATPAAKAPVRQFRLDDIPDVMRSRLGWKVAAALMARWFANPAWTMSDRIKVGDTRPSALTAAQLDESIVTMGWALGYPRVAQAMSTLQTQWASDKGKARLRDLVQAAGTGKKNQCWRFGQLQQAASRLDETCQVNIAKFGKETDPMDDLYGAIGLGLLKVAVTGMVETDAQGRHVITVDELGLYIRDTYDFNDPPNAFISQPLGCWGFTGVEGPKLFARDVSIDTVYVDADPKDVEAARFEVQNADFRAYRGKYGRGGDFVLFSDVHPVRLPTPVRIDLSALSP